jgi:flagellin-like protein
MSIMLSKKGITPIIATILLLAMVVAIAASAFFWTSRMQTQMQGGLESYQDTIHTRQVTSAKIVDAKYNDTTGNLTIFIQNTGNVRLPIRACCIWPRTDWILKDANQNVVCSALWRDPFSGLGCAPDWQLSQCVEGCTGENVTWVDVGEIHKVVLQIKNSGSCYTACSVHNPAYPIGEVFSFTINFLGETTAGGTFIKQDQSST